MTKPIIENMLTPSEVASMFGVLPQTVGRWARAGKVKFTRTPGGHRRYREADIRALMEQGDSA
jgi:excisionase family DNA binding protein